MGARIQTYTENGQIRIREADLIAKTSKIDFLVKIVNGFSH